MEKKKNKRIYGFIGALFGFWMVLLLIYGSWKMVVEILSFIK